MPETLTTPEQFIEHYRKTHPMDARSFDDPDNTPPWTRPSNQVDTSVLWRLREALDDLWPNPWNGDVALAGEQKANAAEAAAALITAPLTNTVNNIPKQTVPDIQEILTDALEDLTLSISLALWGEPGFLEAVTERLASLTKDINTAAQRPAFLQVLEQSAPNTASALRQNASNMLVQERPPNDPKQILDAFTKATWGLSADAKWDTAYQIVRALAAKPSREARRRHDQLKDNQSFEDVERLMDMTSATTSALTNLDLPRFTDTVQTISDFTPSHPTRSTRPN